MHILSVWLYDEETETQAQAWAEYIMQPAERKVGIPCAYGELQRVSVWIPAFGSVNVELDEYYAEIVEQAISDQVFEDECNGGYDG